MEFPKPPHECRPSTATAARSPCALSTPVGRASSRRRGSQCPRGWPAFPEDGVQQPTKTGIASGRSPPGQLCLASCLRSQNVFVGSVGWYWLGCGPLRPECGALAFAPCVPRGTASHLVGALVQLPLPGCTRSMYISSHLHPGQLPSHLSFGPTDRRPDIQFFQPGQSPSLGFGLVYSGDTTKYIKLEYSRMMLSRRETEGEEREGRGKKCASGNE